MSVIGQVAPKLEDMLIRKRSFPIALSLLFLGLALPAHAGDFTQADLEKMVAELDKAIPENPNYKYPIKCSIVEKDDVNAYATLTDEGADKRATMVVYSGLLKEVKGEERLVRAVVAHELSHLSLGHNAAIDPAARDLRNLWTRQQEFEADKTGCNALIKLGYPRKDMVDMLLFLDKNQGRKGNWLDNLTADHADPKARAAEVSAKPEALRALVAFDTALAYEDARSHLYAQRLFDYAATLWPDLTEAYVNSGKCSLLFYYDNLPKAVRDQWWRPDFGPLITTPHAPPAQAVEITDQDREAYKDAVTAITKSVDKNPGSVLAEEMLALAQVLEPDKKKETIQKGIDWFLAHAATAQGVLKLRYANNAGVGYHELGDLNKAYETIMAAQKDAHFFNPSVGENLGLVKVTGRSKDDDKLAADVLFTWLNNTPPDSPSWKTVKKTFDEVCQTAGITAKPLETKPAYLCRVVSLATSGKDLGILLPFGTYSGALGAPEKETSFTAQYPDMKEASWHDGKLTVLVERNTVMRITSYEDGAFLLLKRLDATSQDSLKIAVGMTKEQLYGILNEGAGVEKNLARGGAIDAWTYFPGLNMGVLIEDGKVKAITVTPVQYEE
jgi:predicted Zn-dependent protease